MKKSNKDRESEVLKVYNLYWDSYLNGYLETFASTMDDAFEMIGTSESEVCHSKEDGIEFYKAQIQEVVGKTEMRNRIISSKPLDDMFLVNEACDVYILGTPEWTFYSKLRLSTILHETKSGWKIIQQHGSLPDMRVEKGETMAFEKITKENLELRDAVKRRTAELERKNRDLHVEAALEKVRALTMAMHSSEDVGKCIVKMFSELTALGVDEGTRFGIGILNHDNENNQLWTARKNGDEVNMHIGNIDMGSHPLLKSARKAWKEQIPLHKYVLEGEDLLDYYRMLNKAPDYKIQIPLEKLPKKEIQHCFIFEHGFFYAFSPREFQPELIHITKRFSSLFAQTYQRYLDLVRAEAQAHDAEIELALERVRARTMAMQHSDELTEASVVLDQQVRALGIETWGCAFHIYADDPEGDYEWFSSREGTLPFYKTPRENFFLKFYEKGKAGETFHVEEFLGEDCKVHYDYLMTIPVMGDALREIVSSGASLPESQYDHIAFFKHGFLLFITYKQVPESHAIFQRFAKVFEQTYTRFLDLQKAEAQAREAKIEAALERVRSRTMAMHHTEELKEVIQVVFEQMVGLSIHVEHAGFILDYKEREDMHIWLTDHQQGVPTEITFPYFDSPHWNSYIEAKAKGESFFANLLPFEVKNKFYRDLFELIPELTEEAQQAIFNKPGLAISTVLLENVGLYIEHYSETPFNAEENAVLMRFGKVFQQTYTRFLDLQKAEAQAREAQIEVALERVRARAMAMRSSNELIEVANVIRQQMGLLKQSQLEAFAIHLYSDEGDQFETWVAHKTPSKNKEQVLTVSLTFSKKETQLARQFIKLFHEKPKEYMMHVHGELLKEWNRMVISRSPEFKKAWGKDIPDSQHWFFSDFSGGTFILIARDEPNAESKELTRRASSVFGLAYRRFLDLQKAEAQAREAQIEAALERVRSRTMAMHQSSELNEVSVLLYKELLNLGISDFFNCGYVELHEKEEVQYAWITRDDGTFLAKLELPLKGEDILNSRYDAWKMQKPLFHQVLDPVQLKKHIAFISPQYNNKEADDVVKRFPNPTIFYNANFKYGYLHVNTGKYLDDEGESILIRFTQVFAQTYTRFLDLQKAEAQAREAQIEAGLERVRARAMAMHKSDELGQAAEVLYKELRILGLSDFINCGYVEIDEQNQCQYGWMTNSKGQSMERFYLPLIGEPILQNRYNAWKRKVPVFCQVVEGKELKDHLSFVNPQLGSQEVREHVKKNFPSPTIFYSGNFSDGYLSFITGTPIGSDGELLLNKFTRVFEMTYKRFLDLGKAEAQAREAQINLAVERIRAMALAMHQTSELKEVIKIVDDQIKALNVDNSGGAFIVINEDLQDGFRCWGAGGVGNYIRKVDIPFLDRPIYKELKKGIENRTPFFTENYGYEEKWEFFKHLFKHAPFDETPPERQKALLSNSMGYARSCVVSNNTSIFIINHNGKAFKEDENKILREIGRVFEQAYTRFLDLQKAEAQAHEAKIEAALEKVRSRTMGMQSSKELPEVANLLFLEVQGLGVPAWSSGFNILAEDGKSAAAWMSSEGVLQEPFKLRLFGESSFDEMGAFINSKDSFMVQELGGNALVEHYDHMKSFPDLKPTFSAIEAQGLTLPTYQINHLCKFSHGFLLFITYEQVPDAHDIFRRFTKIFDQTYTRFLDLQKAEAQAREARIEAALERVRSRTMGMQKAEELGEVATILFGEMNTLVDNLWTCGFVLCEKNRKEDEWWLSLTNGLIEPFSLPNVGDYAHEVLYEGWEKGELYRTVTLENAQLQEHYNWLMKIPIAAQIFEDMEATGIPRPNWQRLHAAYFKTGYLVIITEVPCEEEEIFKRFAQVFDLTYTRFLDLQKAEKQAREAQIQAALEKVRSRSLAMQSPDELIEVAQLLREEMGELGVEELETSSIYIQDESSGLTECWFTIKNTANPGKAVADQMTIKLEETWVGRQMRDFFQSSAEKTSILMQGKNRKEWIRYCEGKSKLFGTSNFYGETIPERTYHLYKFSNGYIGAAAPGEISSESWDLLKRATAVFSFAFTRFQDLQRAEASARAAMRQASLDRVRADISSMRSASDLDRITPLIFKELTVLGVPFIRCGVFIIQEKQKIVEAYLSSPEGNSLGVLRLPYRASELTYQTVEAWRKGVVYHQHWNKEDFIQWINQLMEQDQIQDSSTYQGAAAPPESLDLHFVPFAQGMLYVGAVNPLDDEELELVQALAKAFSIAYARFEDFVKLEQAKAEVESAMSELKATQSQLVQQEKLASLGQLTAGIAHEIKNPLNFVNNFSEVSIELVDEAIEERSKSQEARDETLVDEILEDIKSNLKKVHEHGSRANGIVTSMLQHSRGGSGKKEPTDLNALIKEYVNLSFHGMRAGKNPINVDIILDLDPEVKEVSLIKEDFTRVIINLCNNAFDAMRTVTTLHEASLSVRTKKQGDTITIEVADNGPGIPDDIKDKILQPFFTTKKGTEGTGLGLSITHDIVKAHGGELRVESQEGLGTVFSIHIHK